MGGQGVPLWEIPRFLIETWSHTEKDGLILA